MVRPLKEGDGVREEVDSIDSSVSARCVAGEVVRRAIPRPCHCPVRRIVDRSINDMGVVSASFDA